MGFLAYTSLAGLVHAKFVLEANHRAADALIEQSGIAHALLRDNWYLELAQGLLSAAAGTGRLPYYAGDAKVSWALKRNLAEAGARVIAAGSPEGAIELAGDPVTYLELAQAVAEATGNPVKAVPATRAVCEAWLRVIGSPITRSTRWRPGFSACPTRSSGQNTTGPPPRAARRGSPSGSPR